MNEVEGLMARIEAEPEILAHLSCGERIVATLLLNQLDLQPKSNQHPVDAAVSRLGSAWLEMVIEYRRNNCGNV